ncbi:Protein of unknown function [Fontimonas thermophila]|uniref:DUF3187 family protein n=2 Tax=Fontimonas thermophila TaxID=1076937 RepID=A0A1I2H1E1_9GAMM|nr:Protein of unknown function [Fontimonas thermophila]
MGDAVYRRARFVWMVCAMGSMLAGATAAQAREPFVFAAFNQAALARHAPLPAPAAFAPHAGMAVVLDWTNETVLEQAGGEQVRLDGEALRLGLSRRWAWDDAVIGVELPLLVTGGGVLDAVIEHWHEWFGLPNGGREQIAQDEYRYRYVRDGVTVFDVGGSDDGIGDLRLSTARCIGTAGCWRALVQLPTADADRLLGGGLGGSLWYERGYALDRAGRWRGAIAGGGAALRADGPLKAQQRTRVPFGWVSLGYALTDVLDAGVQVYAHGALYDGSALDALSRAGGQVVFGVRYRGAAGQWWLAVQEDALTRSSPDFVIHVAADWGAD